MNFGFVRVAAAVPKVKVANCTYNTNQIIELMKEAWGKNVELCLFPELSITSYTCGDLFLTDSLYVSSLENLAKILKTSENLAGMVTIVGMPIRHQGMLFNCAVVIQSGRILGISPKIYLSQHSEFNERRWFNTPNDSTDGQIEILDQEVSFGSLLFTADSFKDFKFAVEISEDLWAPIPPSSQMALNGVVCIFNLSATNELVDKHKYRRGLIAQQSARCFSAYVYSSAGVGESTTDLVFGGYACVCENGDFLSESDRFLEESNLLIADIDILTLVNERRKNTSFYSESDEYFEEIEFTYNSRISTSLGKFKSMPNLYRYIDPHPFVPTDEESLNSRINEIINIQTAGIIKRMRHIDCKNTVIGVSGGLDSTLALLVLVNAYDRMGLDRSLITAITMPGFGTSKNTYNNALDLMKDLRVTFKEIPIEKACKEHLKSIGHPLDLYDVTFENVQARERTQILMNYANMINGIVIGTGDMSELALGWCTYNGDQMSHYSLNSGIPKTLVSSILKVMANNFYEGKTRKVLLNIIETPISPELLPLDSEGSIIQKTEDIVGPYELHDFYLYHLLKYGASPEKLLFLAQIAFNEKYEYNTLLKCLKTFIKRFFSQQFKRSCMPDGPKIGSIHLSPRSDLKMPSDACADIWLEKLAEL